MINCKDCIHDGICHLQYMMGKKNKDIKLSDCSDFKDKSDYVSFSECNKRIREYFKSVIDSGEYIVEVTDANADIQRILEGIRE